MIHLADPAHIGPALAGFRDLLGLSRRQCARKIAEATGRTESSVNAQLWTWDVEDRTPDLKSLGPYLDALGVRLLLDFQDESTADSA
jgi:hypothetical protein